MILAYLENGSMSPSNFASNLEKKKNAAEI
jgi:hypothetical protein